MGVNISVLTIDSGYIFRERNVRKNKFERTKVERELAMERAAPAANILLFKTNNREKK